MLECLRAARFEQQHPYLPQTPLGRFADVCGMNFEYIAPMPHSSDPTFSAAAMATHTEPKDHPTTLIVEEAGKRVTLHQAPTPDRAVETWMTYTVRPLGCGGSLFFTLPPLAARAPRLAHNHAIALPVC